MSNNNYYSKLNLDQKELFEKRVHQFIKKKTFFGRENFIVTDEVKISIAASAVQITFGLDTWDLSYFNHILVYPSEYKNPNTGKLHKGETNMGGFICLSWEDFVKGNQNPTDKINLGLHEFAHALRFNGIRGNETDYFFDNYFNKWIAVAKKEFDNLKNSSNKSIFRKYGSVNINELFSVVAETFFEKPLEFKEYNLDLFNHTSILLNQTFSNDGNLHVNCREELLKTVQTKLNRNYTDALSYNLKYNGLSFFALGFTIIGMFSLSNKGYLYPSPYILFTIALLVWFYLEKNYTRIYFYSSHFIVEKGYKLIRGHKKIILPYSQLISFNANFEKKENKKELTGIFVVYYNNTHFYEVDLYADVINPDFKELCRDLNTNNTHLFMRSL